MKLKCCFIFFILLLFHVTGNTPANVSKLTEVEKKIKNNRAKLLPKIQQKKKATQNLNKIKRDVKYNQLKLNRIEKKLSSVKKEHLEAKADYKKAKKNYTLSKIKLKDRLRLLHKENGFSILIPIFDSQSWSDSLESVYFTERILQNDYKLIKALNLNYKEIHEKRKILEEKTKKMLILKKDRQKRKSILNNQQSLQENHISKLHAEIQKLERHQRDLEKMSEELSQLIYKESNENIVYLGTGKFLKPVKGWISSRFGMRVHPIFKRKIKHTGIDIAAPKGYKIRAAESGKVIFSGTKGGYGKSVLIYHGKRKSDNKALSSFYAHQSRIVVKHGDVVKKGDVIGFVGATGYATGPHLHFEVKLDDRHVNPLNFL